MEKTEVKTAGYPDFEIYPARASSDNPGGGENEEDDDVCWICTDARSEEDPADWVRPCKCSLVSHQSCLKSWVDSKQTSGEDKVLCPQCKTTYRMVDPHHRLTRLRSVLRAIESANNKPPWALVCVTLPIALGYTMVRAFMGASGTRMLLTGTSGVAGHSASGRVLDTFSPARWDKAAFVLLPILPVGMLLCDLGVKMIPKRSNILRILPCYLIPWLPLAVIGHYSDTARGRLFRVDASFPPGPVTTLAGLQILSGVLPLLRNVLYRALFKVDAPSWIHAFTGRQDTPVAAFLFAGAIETTFNPLNAWAYGQAAAALGRRWLPLGRLLGLSGPGLAPAVNQTWRVEGVQPDWWAAAIGGLIHLAISDVTRLGGFLVMQRKRRDQRVLNYADVPPKSKAEDEATRLATDPAGPDDANPQPAPAQPPQRGWLARLVG